MFRILVPLLLSLAAVPAIASDRVVQGLPLADPAPTGEEGLLARIFFTSNHRGEFETCTCPDTPLGGIAQAAGSVASARDAGLPVFWLDAGDRLFRFDMAMTGTEEAERRLKSILLVDAGSLGGLDAMGVGRLDLGAGLPYLEKLARRASFRVLSANLVGEDGETVFETSLVLERDGQRIGVTSVLPAGLDGQGFDSTDPFKAARREVASLRSRGVDLVVVLSNLGLAEDRRLARVSRADLIVGSHSRELTREGQRVGRSLLAEAGSRGRYLGDVRWYRTGPGRGPYLVATAMPVYGDAPRHPGVDRLVVATLERLADPVLGVPPVRLQGFDDPAFRGRELP